MNRNWKAHKCWKKRLFFPISRSIWCDKSRTICQSNGRILAVIITVAAAVDATVALSLHHSWIYRNVFTAKKIEKHFVNKKGVLIYWNAHPYAMRLYICVMRTRRLTSSNICKTRRRHAVNKYIGNGNRVCMCSAPFHKFIFSTDEWIIIWSKGEKWSPNPKRINQIQCK